MAIFVTQVSPDRLLTGQSREITLTGAGFTTPVSVILNGTNIIAFMVTDRLVKFVLPFVPAGTYDITVVNGDGSRWTSRQVFTVTDPPAGSLGDLGSAQRPIVLPPVQIEAKGTAKVSAAVAYRNLNSAATVKNDSTSGTLTATLKQDMSYLPSEPVKLPDATPAGQVLETPWGTFKNE